MTAPSAFHLPGHDARIPRYRDVVGAGEHLIVVVTLPDRPGALGAVASRLGAIGANITDVQVARGSGEAHDTFHLNLPPSRGGVDLQALLHTELREVDGVRIEYIAQPPDGCCAD